MVVGPTTPDQCGLSTALYDCVVNKSGAVPLTYNHNGLGRLLSLLQCQYDLLPPSLARFSPTDPDVIVYTGYGLEKCVQFYSISRKSVFRTLALTHWPTAFDVSPQGHLLAFGCQGTCTYKQGSEREYTIVL